MSGTDRAIVRPATPADVPGVLPMVRELCALHRSWDFARFSIRDDAEGMYAEWLPKRANDPRSVFLVAERAIEGRAALCGFIIGTTEQNLRIYTLSEFAYLHDLWVDPAARGLGIGGRLIDEAVSRFTAMGISQIRGETALANEHARAMLMRHGFRIGTIDVVRDRPG